MYGVSRFPSGQNPVLSKAMWVRGIYCQGIVILSTFWGSTSKERWSATQMGQACPSIAPKVGVSAA